MSAVAVRPASPADIRAYGGRDLPPECVETVAYLAERGGVVVALGGISWDKWGRVWGWYDSRERVSAFTMHRLARRMIGHLRGIGVGTLHAYCDDGVPSADRWLRRLGFRPAPIVPGAAEPVWTCSL